MRVQLFHGLGARFGDAWRGGRGPAVRWLAAGLVVLMLAIAALWLWRGRDATRGGLEGTVTALNDAGQTRLQEVEFRAQLAALRGEIAAGRPPARIWSYYEVLRSRIDARFRQAPPSVRKEAQQLLQEVGRGLAVSTEAADRALEDLAAFLEQRAR